MDDEEIMTADLLTWDGDSLVLDAEAVAEAFNRLLARIRALERESGRCSCANARLRAALVEIDRLASEKYGDESYCACNSIAEIADDALASGPDATGGSGEDTTR